LYRAWMRQELSQLLADIVTKVFLAFGRETLIQDRARTRNNDSKEPTLRLDCYKFLFHRACWATFATQSALVRHSEMASDDPVRMGLAQETDIGLARPAAPCLRVHPPVSVVAPSRWHTHQPAVLCFRSRWPAGPGSIDGAGVRSQAGDVD